MSGKKISIIIPTFNRPEKLTQLTEKVLSFCTTGVEVIVVDDSQKAWSISDDQAQENELKYFHRGRKLGVSSARNFGSDQAKGEYLLFLDDDDDFSDQWISDFLAALPQNPDLIFCQMKRIEPNGEVSIEVAKLNRGGKLTDAIFIPGAWMIKKELFHQLGRYDERLKYAENTELFIRINQVAKKFSLIDRPNFFYHPSPDGGSKNLRNMIDSLHLILEKHSQYLTPHVKHLYHQIIGVNWMRFRNFSKARFHLFEALKYKPSKLATWGRLGLAYLPFLAKRFYSDTVSHG